MTSKVMPSIVQIEEDSLKKLVTEVKETIATNIKGHSSTPESKKFGVTDMWHAQKSVRTAISRRRYHTKAF